MNKEAILIGGASGLIGTRLTHLLAEKGYAVSHVSRSKRRGPVECYQWNLDDTWIEPGALSGKQVIVNLAGAGIGDKPWTERRKKEIIESRTRSTLIFFEALQEGSHQVHTYISASGIGYYGTAGGDRMFTEMDPPGDDFLALVTRLWEEAADRISSLNIRVVKLRTGPALSGSGGILSEFANPIRWYVGAPLGSGKQYISWIHIDDLCRMYIHAIEKASLVGPYNAVAPVPVTNREMMETTARALRRPIILPPIPKFVLKGLLGEMAYLALEGSKVSSSRVRDTGFSFHFDTLSKALSDLF